MNKGYQVVEPKALDRLIANSLQRDFAVATLSWLCQIIRLELAEHLQFIDVEVICVTYMGSYPAIGIHYKTEGYQNMGPIIESIIDRFLKERSALELTQYVSNSNVNWKHAATQIMHKI
jgi:hypothetical protein